jgi:hypothetical protein
VDTRNVDRAMPAASLSILVGRDCLGVNHVGLHELYDEQRQEAVTACTVSCGPDGVPAQPVPPSGTKIAAVSPGG